MCSLAVNYWAERYLTAEPELQKFRPFTSEDIDFKGTHEDVQRIARQLALHPSYPPKVAITALAGTVPFQIGDLRSNIEIVRRIPGVSKSVEALAVEAALDGRTIRVLDPVSLLACKLELVASVPQEKRRDRTHLEMLVPCVRAFLSEFLQQVETGQLPVRGCLGAANQVLNSVPSLHLPSGRLLRCNKKPECQGGFASRAQRKGNGWSGGRSPLPAVCQASAVPWPSSGGASV